MRTANVYVAHRSDHQWNRPAEQSCLRLAQTDYLDLESLALPHYLAPRLTSEQRTRERSAISPDDYSFHRMSARKLQEAVRHVVAPKAHHLRAQAPGQREIAIDLLAFGVRRAGTLDVNGEQVGVEFGGRKHSLSEQMRSSGRI